MVKSNCLIAGAVACALLMTAAPVPGAAGAAAYENALAARDFENAALHASTGCTAQRDVGSCRSLAALPIHIGNSGAPVPERLADTLRDAATRTCRSAQPLRDILRRDVTGRECAHLARRFVLARDPDYRSALGPHAVRFFESIYEPARAARLYALACARYAHGESCAARGALAGSRVINVAAFHETLDLLDQEIGPGMRAAIASLTCERDAPPGAAARAAAACGTLAGARPLELAPAE